MSVFYYVAYSGRPPFTNITLLIFVESTSCTQERQLGVGWHARLMPMYVRLDLGAVTALKTCYIMK